MVTNVIEAICNLVAADFTLAADRSGSRNRMNSRGEAVETFVKDAFAAAIGVDDLLQKRSLHDEHFSYTGNQNNPPDFMIKGGDAVEVKKVEGMNALSLNSSYPKTRLYADSPMISQECRNAEAWTVKDFLYVIARVESKTNEVRRLWFVYGDCYAAEASVYELPRDVIRVGLAMTDLELSVTKELGRVNNVDPLGITDMRIRGMYLLKQPEYVFGRYLQSPDSQSTRITAVMTKEKYLSMPPVSVARLKVLEQQGLTVSEVLLPDPNDPASAIAGVVIDWVKS